jgi:MFS family permease
MEVEGNRVDSCVRATGPCFLWVVVYSKIRRLFSGEKYVLEALKRIRNPRSPLWRNLDFLKFWAGQSISEVGSRITREALPLAAVLTLGATPMMMGWLRVASAVPVVLLGLIVGAYIDRFPRRPFLIVTDALRCLILLTIPVAAVTKHLGMWMVISVSALMSIFTLTFTVAYESYIPTLVGRDRLVDGNTKLSITQSFAEIVGPGLAGTLVQTVTAPMAILLDALSYLVSAFCIWSIRKPESGRSGRHEARHLWNEIREGLHTVAHNRTLLALALTAATSALFSSIYYTMDVLFALRTLHMGPALFGLTVTFGGIGALIGATVCQPLSRRFGYGPVLVASALLYGLFNWLIPLAHGPAWFAALFLIGAQVLGDCFGVVFEVLESSLRQAVTADDVLGRVNASINLLTSVLGPIGALLGGWIATEFSLRAATAVGVGGVTLAALWLFLAPIAGMKSLPSTATLSMDENDHAQC